MGMIVVNEKFMGFFSCFVESTSALLSLANQFNSMLSVYEIVCKLREVLPNFSVFVCNSSFGFFFS